MSGIDEIQVPTITDSLNFTVSISGINCSFSSLLFPIKITKSSGTVKESTASLNLPVQRYITGYHLHIDDTSSCSNG